MYKIYNHTSAKMKEIGQQSVDLIFTSPPYNISTSYGKYRDNLSLKAYQKFLQSVIGECARVIKKDGKLIIEVADSVLIGSKYLQLAALIAKYCLAKDFVLVTRYINFIKTSNKVELADHNMTPDFINKGDTHSNCHQLLIFVKKPKQHEFKDEVLYINYLDSKEHPCPTPKAMLTFILNRYFKKGYKVLDPFSGTANLGAEVLKRGGDFYGYEINSGFCKIAEQKLKSFKY
ncbi:MAG: site-specific DNA-methyltransferase [Candidatus Parcubacteria bacterium]|nr:site-specific DNA-methyltransferase [Candidatus Parcubacteria bacterium]